MSDGRRHADTHHSLIPRTALSPSLRPQEARQQVLQGRYLRAGPHQVPRSSQTVRLQDPCPHQPLAGTSTPPYPCLHCPPSPCRCASTCRCMPRWATTSNRWSLQGGQWRLTQSTPRRCSAKPPHFEACVAMSWLPGSLKRLVPSPTSPLALPAPLTPAAHPRPRSPFASVLQAGPFQPYILKDASGCTRGRG